MDKLTALTVFRLVCELGSFSGAARKLRLSNAAVSKNVRELEDELGARLLERTTRRVRMTDAGEAYFLRARAILDELRALDAETKDVGRTPRGTLRVAAPMSLGIAQIAPAVGAFLVAHPALHVELEMNDRYVDLVGEGFDVALRGGKLADSSLVYSLSKSPARWTLIRKSRRIRVDIQGPLSVNSSLALAGAAQAGAGIALLPEVTVRDALATRRLVPVLEGWSAEPQSLFGVYPPHHQVSQRVRLFLDFLAARFGERA